MERKKSRSEISLEDLKKYITYTKMNFYPRLTEESGHMLQDLYVSDRMASKDQRFPRRAQVSQSQSDNLKLLSDYQNLLQEFTCRLLSLYSMSRKPIDFSKCLPSMLPKVE